MLAHQATPRFAQERSTDVSARKLNLAFRLSELPFATIALPYYCFGSAFFMTVKDVDRMEVSQ